jgi:hypothetical protein
MLALSGRSIANTVSRAARMMCAGSSRLIFVFSVYIRLAASDWANRGSFTPPHIMPTTLGLSPAKIGEPLDPPCCMMSMVNPCGLGVVNG